ncbi:MAG TPA: hypothetical protein VD837_11940 [Terriglobales bacterium]|nr:hypothetical protein [Terriglobales bacterium]
MTDSKARVAAAAAGAFALAGGLKFAAVGMFWRFGVTRRFLRLQDAAMTGALAALIVWLLLWAVAERRRDVREQIQAVSMLNHDLRNALEVILGSEYLPKSSQAEAILGSVTRIERTLQKLLDDTGNR